jgi:RNA polymerase sigma factor (sigma-70 family)
MTTTDFEAFFRGSYRDLIRYVMMLGASVSDADEVAQEAMTAAYRRWPRIDNPKAWTWRVACRTYLRADRRRRLREVLAPAEHLPDRAGVDPADALLGAYRVRMLLRGLAARQRRVVAWWLDGYQFDEIAEKLDVKTATVRSLFRHARKRLRERFRTESPWDEERHRGR